MKKTLKTIFIVIISILMMLVMSTNANAETTGETGGGEGTETEEFYLTDETKTVKLNSTGYLSYKNKPSGESIV